MQLLPKRSSKATSLAAAADGDALVLPALLEFQSPSIAIINAPNPLFARSAIWIVASMFVASVAALGLIPVEEVVSVQGKVISRSPSILMQPFDTAIVRSIDVHVGQSVHAGDVLAKLDPTLAVADEQALAAQVSIYGSLVQRLQAEHDGQPFSYSGTDRNMLLQNAIYDQRQSQYKYQVENYNQQIAAQLATIARSDADAAGYRQRLALARSVEQMRTQLEKLAVGSRLNTLAAQDTAAEMARALADAEHASASAKGTLASLSAQRDAYIQQWRADVSQQLSDASSKLSDAQQSLNKAQLHSQLVVMRADQDAYVMSIARVSPGSVLQAGQQFITLVPSNSPLEIEVNIPGTSNGSVRVGEQVTIKFATFDAMYYGMGYGTIRVISPDSFYGQDQQTEMSGAVPVANGDLTPYYRGRVTIDRLAMRNMPPDFKLIPGMPVTGDINTGKRTMLSYVFSKVLSVPREAMREPD